MNEHPGLENKVYCVGAVELFDGPQSRRYACCEIEKPDTEGKKDEPGDELDFLFLPAGITITRAVVLAAFTPVMTASTIVENATIRSPAIM